MNIQTTLTNYKAQGIYFAPDYEQDNLILSDFKKTYSTLSEEQVSELIKLLIFANDLEDKYFVADLLYLYNSFSLDLIEAMLDTAILHKDPSINRIFLRPCINVLGTKKVADLLLGKFKSGDILQRIGVSKLVYWLRPQENGEADSLHYAIIEKANSIDSIIELYHYKLIYSDKIKQISEIPNNASELIKAIKGNKEHEDLLFNKLKWLDNGG